MLINHPELDVVFVQTPRGEAPDSEELAEAARLIYGHGFRRKETCPSIGFCAVRVEHSTPVANADAPFRVDEYALVCDAGCPQALPEKND